jgi:hypothetical protein
MLFLHTGRSDGIAGDSSCAKATDESSSGMRAPTGCHRRCAARVGSEGETVPAVSRPVAGARDGLADQVPDKLRRSSTAGVWRQHRGSPSLDTKADTSEGQITMTQTRGVEVTQSCG